MKTKDTKNKKKQKEFTVEFVQLVKEIETKNSFKKQIVGIGKILNELLTENSTNLTFPYHDDKLKLESIKKVPLSELRGNLTGIDTLWELNFIRIQDKLVEGIIENDIYNENGLEEFLGDNKKLTESLSVLYDSQKSIFIVEKNIKFQLSALLHFFISLLEDDSLNFAMIPDKDKLNKLKNSEIITSFDLTLINIKDPKFKKDFLSNKKLGSLSDAIGNLAKFNNNKLNILLSVNGNSKTSLETNSLKESAEYLLGKAEFVNKLIINTKENSDSHVEKINLFENRLKDIQRIKYEKNESKKHKDIVACLKSAYNKKKVAIDKL